MAIVFLVLLALIAYFLAGISGTLMKMHEHNSKFEPPDTV